MITPDSDKAFSVVITDHDIYTWSAALYALLGYDRSVPASMDNLLALIHPEDRDAILEEFSTYRKKGVVAEQKAFRIITPQNQEKRLITTTQEEVSVNGIKVLLVVFYEFCHLSRELKLRDQRYEAIKPVDPSFKSLDLHLDAPAIHRAAKQARLGWWEYYAVSDEFRWTHELYAIFQIDPLKSPTKEVYEQTLHPEDRALFQDALLKLMPSDTPWEGEIRHVLPSGKIIYTYTSIENFWEDGRVVKSFGVVQDVTKLRESESRLKHVQKIAKVGWYELDLQNKAVTGVSEEYLRMHAMSAKSEVPSFDFFIQRFCAEGFDIFKEKDRRTLEASNVQYKIPDNEGMLNYLDSSIRVIRSPVTDVPVRLIGVTRDLTELKETELYLQEAQEIANVGWFEWSTTLGLTNASDAFREIHQISGANEVISWEDIFSLVHPDDRDEFQKIINDPERIESGFSTTYRIVTEDASIRYIQNKVRRIKNTKEKDGNKIIGIVQDITELKQTEFRLKQAQLISKTGWYEYDLTDITKSKFSEEWMTMHDFPPDFFPKSENDYIQKVHPKDRAKLSSVEDYLRDKPQEWDNLEIRLQTETGETRYISNSSRVIYTDRKPVKIFGTTRDITDIKLAQKALYQSEQRYRLLSENSRDVIFLLEGKLGNTLITYVSDYVKPLLGYEKEELLGQPSLDLVHVNDKLDYVQIKNSIISDGKDSAIITFRLKKKSGEYVWTEALVSHFKNSEKQGLQMSIRDVSDRKRVELELTKASTDLKALIKSTDQIVFIITSYQTFETVIARDESKLHMPSSFFLKKPITQVWTDENGQILIGLVRKVLQTHQSAYHEYQYAVNGKEEWYKAGVHYFKGFDRKDRVTVYLAAITKQKKVEEDLQRSVQMERELSQMRSNFVSMASHQFRTPLTVIKSNMQLLESAKVDHPVVTRVSARLIREVDRLVNLMEDILILGRVQSDNMRVSREEFGVADLLQDIKRDVDLEQMDGRELQIEVVHDFEVYLDKSLMRHAILNLITNAFKYSQGGSCPLVRVNEHKNKTVCLSIIDYGIGIASADRQRIFKDFFRADDVREIQGTGLGLSITSEFLRLNGCELHLDSTLGKGSVFEITIPREYVN